MMNKKGFTLVELMVVIVIIGILAAVALPKFADAINKSRASEVPQKIKQMYNAAVVYEGEHGTYAISAAAGGTTDLTSKVDGTLGVKLTSKYFDYTYQADGTTFIASGKDTTGMGDLDKNDSLQMNQDGAIAYKGSAWTKYVPAFVANASAL